MRTGFRRHRGLGREGDAGDGAGFCRGGFAWRVLRGLLRRACLHAREAGFVELFFFGMEGLKHVAVSEEVVVSLDRGVEPS